MSIVIDRSTCIGCGKCKEICPGSLLQQDAEGRAYIRYAEECWGCVSCVKACPVHAIRFYLGADMGGNGSTMYTCRHGDILRWIIEKPDGSTVEIPVNTKESNRY